jgi:tetratricopeptide (TPR) repeat protein
MKNINLMNNDLQDSQIDELLRISNKSEDWLEICFYAEQNSGIDHERLWVGGLEKFNSSALYLENLGYFYYQKGKYHKALEYLSKSHVFEKSFFALTLAMAASYAVTQYHLVLDYYNKLSSRDRSKLNDDLLFKVATSAQYEQNYALALEIFESIHKQNKVSKLPTLQETLYTKFGGSKKMENWFDQMSSRIDQMEHRAKLSMDDLITYASVLMHENKFDKALRHLENVKKERFN